MLRLETVKSDTIRLYLNYRNNDITIVRFFNLTKDLVYKYSAD